MGLDKGKILSEYGKLKGAQFAFAGMNFMVDPADLAITDGQCVDLCNCDVDYQSNVSRRKGYVCVTFGNLANGWSNGVSTYCTLDNRLCAITFTATTTLLSLIPGVPTLNGIVEFKQANDVVVFSDGLTMGILQDREATLFATPTFNF